MKKIINLVFFEKLTENDLKKLKRKLKEKTSIKSIFDYRLTNEELNVLLEALFSEDIDLELQKNFSKDEIEILRMALISEDIKPTFDGKLTKEELQNLKNALIEEKDIEKIEKYLDTYKLYLKGFKDLVGDTGIPNEKLFYLIIEKFGYLLQNDPDLIYSKKGVIIRQKIHFIIKLLGKKFLTNPQIIENSEYLKSKDPDNDIILPDKKIVLPNEPVIWTSNHGFKDDILASILAAKRHSYLVLASLPQFFNTLDGFTAWLNGVILANRKIPTSKASILPKANKVMDLGADVLLFSEGVHNKTSNQLLIDLWPGIYRLATERNSPIVPIIHYIKDPTCKMNNNPIHTVIDDPFKVDNLSEKAALNYLREILATWYQLMNEKYGKTTRKEIMNWYQNRAINEYGVKKEELEKRPLTSQEAFDIHLLDLNSTVERYDSEIETSADYRPKDKIRPEEAFAPISNIKNSNYQNVNDIIAAANITRVRKKEDFQRRF